jgi:hypothetical protein
MDQTEEQRILAAIPWWRRVAYACIGVGVVLAGLLMLGEIACRLLPVNEGLRTQPVNAENPIHRFQPNRSSIWSRGWNFSIVNQVHVNNDGFVNDQDYVADGPRPLVAVVGDSYIEAGMVPFRETVQGRLATNIGKGGRVYSYAASGAGLSQYLVWAEYARDKFRPDIFLFLNISNDFSESLYHLERSPGFHHFEKAQDGSAVMRRVDFEPRLFRRLLRYSALATYLVTNVKVEALLKFQYLGGDDRRWAGNISRDASPELVADYEWAVRQFLDSLPKATGLPPERIMIAIDGIREAVYSPAEKPELERSLWGRMRVYMSEQAAMRGFAVIDMQPVFERAFAKDHKRFEFPTDSHWNGYAHGLLADAVASTSLYRSQNSRVR